MQPLSFYDINTDNYMNNDKKEGIMTDGYTK